jgi:hypothetical protein
MISHDDAPRHDAPMKTILPSLTAATILVMTVAASGSPDRWRAEGWKTDFSKATVPLSEVLSGGPARDGIPPIDKPTFKPASEVGELSPREPVIVFPLDANARAYPLRILTWHEIVNDTIAGVPVAVTYCPLCNAALVFDRRVAGRVLDFGTSGLLRNSDLVMWDRQTESWWQQFTGEAIVGSYAGESLKMLPSRLSSYGEFVKQWSNGPVLVPNNPRLRDYGRNPYVGYDDRSAPYELFQGNLPKGVPAMARVVVARRPIGPVSVTLSLLAERGRIVHEGVTFKWQAGQTTALGASDITKGRDVGSVEVTDAGGAPLVYDVTFAFVLHAFQKDAVVLMEKGRVNLTTGAIVTQ